MKNLHKIRPHLSDVHLAYIWHAVTNFGAKKIVLHPEYLIMFWSSYNSIWDHWGNRISKNNSYLLDLWREAGRPIVPYELTTVKPGERVA